MKRLILLLSLALLGACHSYVKETKSRVLFTEGVDQIELRASDGVRVFGTSYSAEKPKATILLFHQAGSSSTEYATIAPRLAAAGYDALAIDQRSGGSLYGENRTVKALGHSVDYLAVKADLQAAIDWARTKKQPIILWGSSYSSSLVFLLAAKNPDVAAVMAFSPGEYFDDKKLIERAAAKLAMPVYVTSANTGDEIAAAKAIADAVAGRQTTRFVPVAGVHGSSTLIATRNPKGAAANWASALGFLKRVAP